MSIREKIKEALEYVERLTGTIDEQELRNDAANIFAENYEEYLSIWNALEA